ncbi:alkaline shock response membrane anchor protein AmaP [Sphaerisporangium corydalis]|uniref:Alkaline shock response membrane anchor protein AmaP n=1 Tax=Sphaerisporangium corydalis TaxID=1441875 RepID=A0ABV9EB91_9ACTN|nr:alkaline shock response membrane anchor protein AmaP [Sphaerisporangium corydalis]
MSHRTARVNRAGLAIVGLVLAVAGGLALARGLGMSFLWPPYSPVISEQTAGYAAGHGWFWPAVALAALVVEILALRWLLLQGRTDSLRRLSLEPDSGHGATHLSARAAAGALEDDVRESLHAGRGERAPRGERVRASLSGAPGTPRVALAMVLPDETDPSAARHGAQGAVTRLRQSLELDRLPATIRMHTTRTHP